MCTIPAFVGGKARLLAKISGLGAIEELPRDPAQNADLSTVFAVRHDCGACFVCCRSLWPALSMRAMNSQRQSFDQAVPVELEPSRLLSGAPGSAVRDPVQSDVRLHAIFRIRLQGEAEPLTIQTVGEAYRFLLDSRHVEWLEHYGLHKRACTALTAASERAVLARAATDAVRALFRQAKLL